MNYVENNQDGPSVDWQESHNEAVACAQMEYDQAMLESTECEELPF